MSFLLECAMLETHRYRRGYAGFDVTKVSLVSFIPSLRGEKPARTAKRMLFSQWRSAEGNSPNSPVVCNSLKEGRSLGEFAPDVKRIRGAGSPKSDRAAG
jgi:hypothetical protein